VHAGVATRSPRAVTIPLLQHGDELAVPLCSFWYRLRPSCFFDASFADAHARQEFRHMPRRFSCHD